jgi:stress-induced morphogen
MAMEASEIEKLIKESLPDAIVTIEDLRGDGDHYSCNVISKKFIGQSRVKQHQMVYDSLKGRMGNELHALALQTSTPK